MDDLGQALVNISRTVPDGLLVFFPSYAAMQLGLDRWQTPPASNGALRGDEGGGRSIWEQIAAHKTPLVEPRDKRAFDEAIAEYYRCVRESLGGAAFFAVCRGMVSEGLDFADGNGRAAVVTGDSVPCDARRQGRRGCAARSGMRDAARGTDARTARGCNRCASSGSSWTRWPASQALTTTGRPT